MLIRKCAWCNKIIGIKQIYKLEIKYTAGICPKCTKKALKDYEVKKNKDN